MLLSKHRELVRCNIDVVHFNISLMPVVESIVRVLKRDSSSNGQVIAVA